MKGSISEGSGTKLELSRPQVTSQVTPEVTPQVLRLLEAMKGDMDRQALQKTLGLKAEKNFRLVYIRPALSAALIEMTIPDKPRSSKQRYRITGAGLVALRRRRGEQ